MDETEYRHLGNFPLNKLCSLSVFVVVARAAEAEQLACNDYLNGCEESTTPLKESALPGLQGLALSAAMP